jgi:tRNA uridine 5-carboxymethylaminomethyl modification enzyme
MFTSRAEHRLLLREDNADLRLSERAFHLGLLSEDEYGRFTERRNQIDRWKGKLDEFFLLPVEKTNVWLAERGQPALKDRVSGEAFLRRPEISWAELCDLGFQGQDAPADVAEQVEIQTKYAGYISRDLELLEGVRKQEFLKIPGNLDFDRVAGLSNEIKGQLKVTRPETIGQASRIQGVTPAAVANIMIHLRMGKCPREAEAGSRN